MEHKIVNITTLILIVGSLTFLGVFLLLSSSLLKGKVQTKSNASLHTDTKQKNPSPNIAVDTSYYCLIPEKSEDSLSVNIKTGVGIPTQATLYIYRYDITNQELLPLGLQTIIDNEDKLLSVITKDVEVDSLGIYKYFGSTVEDLDLYPKKIKNTDLIACPAISLTGSEHVTVTQSVQE